jgi:hypothetical protein
MRALLPLCAPFALTAWISDFRPLSAKFSQPTKKSPAEAGVRLMPAVAGEREGLDSKHIKDQPHIGGRIREHG